MSVPGFREAVLAWVARIPRGRVATYGQIAWMAGYPRRPRQVGMVLRGLPGDTDIPWQRVVNAQGLVPPRGLGWERGLHIARLREEGVPVSEEGVLDLRRHLWDGAGGWAEPTE